MEKFVKRPLAFCDIEVYPNAFLIGFTNEDNVPRQYGIYGMSGKSLDREQRREISNIISKKTLITFNGVKYDIPIIMKALQGATIGEIYKMSIDVVKNNLQEWQTKSKYEVEYHRMLDHIDISEVAQGVMVSLKGYAARLGATKLQDLPYPFDTMLKQHEYNEVVAYNLNDLEVTKMLYDAIAGRVDLRYSMSNQYDTDLRSKSDAQIAEAVMIAELAKKGVTATKPTVPSTLKYIPPKCVEFKTPKLQQIFERIKSETFKLHPTTGRITLPQWLAKEKITIGGTTYNIGVGGLHSQEKKLVVVPNDDEVLRNADVASYYPSMIIEFMFYPKHLTHHFLRIYSAIKDRRLKAKANGDKVVNESLKIVLNGLFGKLGSKYSKVYAPDLLLHVTLTGQLMLLMLIEALETNGFRVVSANTDGVEYVCPKDRQIEAEMLIFDWELATGMEMEHGVYKALYARDVNNYVAVYDKEPKAKGVYAEPTLSKNSEYPIVFDAIRQYLHKGTPLEDTIRACTDIRQFLTSRTVKGGGEWKGMYLGKVVRWYYGKNGDSIHYVSNGNKVPKSDGAVPMMEITDNYILDIDKYIELAIGHLEDLGVSYESKN